MAKRNADPRERVRADFDGFCVAGLSQASIAAILTNAVVSEIVPAAASETGLITQRGAMGPFGSPALASSIFLYCMADEIVIAVPS